MSVRPRELMALLEANILTREPALVVSSPGLGKTDMVGQIAKKLDADLIMSHPSTEDPTDPKGMPWCWNEKGVIKADFIPFGQIEKLIKADRLTVWFIDDLGQAAWSVQAPYMQWFGSRRVNGHILNDNVAIIAATNRKSDKAASNGIIEPLKGRSVIYDLTDDIDDWCMWAYQNNILPDIIACLRANSSILCDFKPTSELTNSPTPRTWHKLSNLMSSGKIPDHLEMEVAKGYVGEAAATHYLGFRRIGKSLSGKNSPDYIILHPDDGGIPDSLDALYVICGTLARKASENTMGRLVTYANRLPAEFSVYLIKDAVSFCKDTVNTKAYVEWLSAHADVVV